MDESFKYGELENLNMKQLIPSLFVLMIVGCSDSIPIEASDTPSPDDLVAPVSYTHLTLPTKRIV